MMIRQHFWHGHGIVRATAIAGIDLALWDIAGKRVGPIHELMEAEEVALHVAHLCDPRNRNMTGSVLLCDGGMSLETATKSND